MNTRIKYRYVVPAASLLPERILRALDHHIPIDRDPADGWSLWTDASYARYARGDKRRNGHLY